LSNFNYKSLSSKEREEILRALNKSEGNHDKFIEILENIFREKSRELIIDSKKFGLFLDNANDFICVVNQSFEFVELNEKFYKNKLGYEASDLIGKSVIEFFHPEDRRRIFTKLQQGFDEGFAMSEFRFKDKEGNWIWMESKGKTFKDYDGKLRGLVISRDITKQRETENRLIKSEKKYRNLITNLFDVVMILDLKGKIEFVSPQIHTNFGYREEELLGHRFFEYVHPKDLARVVEQFKEFPKKISISAEYRAKDANGNYVWVKSKGKIVDFGEKRQIIGTMRKIDKEKRVIKNLKNSERRYRDLFESSLDGIAMVDQQGKVTDCNQAFLNMVGYSKNEVKNLTYQDLTSVKYHKMEEDILQNQVQQRGYSDEYEKEYIKKNGEVFPVSLKTWKINDKNGEFCGYWAIVRDITEKKKAKKRLEKSKEKLERKSEEQQLLLDNIQTQVWYLSDPVTYGSVNEAHANFYGFEKDQMAFRNLYEIFPEDVADVCKEGNIEVFTTKKQINTDEWVPHQSGERRLNSITKTPKLDESGDVEYVVCSAEDVTEQRKYEEMLEKSEKRLKLFIDSSPDMFFLKDKDLKYLLVNKANADFFGEKEQNIIGKTDFDLMSENAAKGCRETDLEAIAKGEPVKSIEKMNERIYETRKIPINDGGKIIGVAGIIRDITESELTESKLKESEQKYRDIAELLPDIIFEGDMRGRFTYTNSAGFRKFGYSEEDLENGINILDLVSEDYKEKALKNVQKVLSGKETEPHEYLLVKKDGSPFYARVHSIPIYKNGKIVGIRGTVSDINRMILAQEKIKESEKKLKKLNRLKSELLRRTSHELKTPLVSIRGFTNLLLEFHSDRLNQEALNYLNEIKDGCDRLGNIIKDILNTAKLQSGRMELKKEELNLSEIIQNAVNAVKGIAKTRNQSIFVEIEEKLMTKGEEEKILAVLENLISNAVKYTPPQGEIFINSERNKQYIIISIKDTGIGFTEDEKKDLFTQFGKIERYGEGFDIDIDGSGLGLYISKKIIELHEGEIWMISEGRNKGSTFYFSLPQIN
jgi:PAS domain S-box-containing protein